MIWSGWWDYGWISVSLSFLYFSLFSHFLLSSDVRKSVYFSNSCHPSYGGHDVSIHVIYQDLYQGLTLFLTHMGITDPNILTPVS